MNSANEAFITILNDTFWLYEDLVVRFILMKSKFHILSLPTFS